MDRNNFMRVLYKFSNDKNIKLEYLKDLPPNIYDVEIDDKLKVHVLDYYILNHNNTMENSFIFLNGRIFMLNHNTIDEDDLYNILNKQLNNNNKKIECVICYDDIKTFSSCPICRSNICTSCSTKINKCPICRLDFQSSI